MEVHKKDGVKKMLDVAQHMQKLYADKKQEKRPHTFVEGQEVMLSIKHLRFKGKEVSKFKGPFKIEKMVGLGATRLVLLKSTLGCILYSMSPF